MVSHGLNGPEHTNVGWRTFPLHCQHGAIGQLLSDATGVSRERRSW